MVLFPTVWSLLEMHGYARPEWWRDAYDRDFPLSPSSGPSMSRSSAQKAGPGRSAGFSAARKSDLLRPSPSRGADVPHPRSSSPRAPSRGLLADASLAGPRIGRPRSTSPAKMETDDVQDVGKKPSPDQPAASGSSSYRRAPSSLRDQRESFSGHKAAASTSAGGHNRKGESDLPPWDPALGGFEWQKDERDEGERYDWYERDIEEGRKGGRSTGWRGTHSAGYQGKRRS